MSDKNSNRARSKPFSKERTKMIICRVIYFYSIFYVVMKVMAMGKGYDLLAQLFTAVPFIVFAALGLRMERQKQYSWTYAILGIVVISAMRYFEVDLLAYFKSL